MVFYTSTTEKYLQIVHQAVHAEEAHGNVSQGTATPNPVKLTIMVTTELLMVVSTLILEVVNMYWPNHVTMMTSYIHHSKTLGSNNVLF